MAAPTHLGPSSRDSEEGAGWRSCAGPGSWVADVPAGTRQSSWLRPSMLWQSRNDVISRLFADPTEAGRARWVELAAQRAEAEGADPDFVLTREVGESFSMIVIGDTGEGDKSQYAVAGPLAEQAKRSEFVVICSDVIYPTGDRADYRRKFHHPYRDVRVPIYAVPGNHDWYDGLHGFMHYFCRIDDDGRPPRFGRGLGGWLAGKLWRRTPAPPANPVPDPAVPEGDRPAPDPLQPAPYFAIDAGPVRFVGIDTGIDGRIDPVQFDWLRRVSLGTGRPKVLLTGKPIYVNGGYEPGAVSGTRHTVDEVVRDPAANYVLAIGGDIHNYQRYPVPVQAQRVIQYLVSGGGGAYMHATHSIPPVRVAGVDESTFRCYPLRRDSLARFSQVIDRRLFGGRGAVAIDPEVAGRFYQRRRITTAGSGRETASRLSVGNWLRATLVHRVRGGRLFHRFGSEIFDFDDPPLFKQFLRLDVTPTELTVVCLGVTGCAGTEHTPTVEDRFTVPLVPR